MSGKLKTKFGEYRPIPTQADHIYLPGDQEPKYAGGFAVKHATLRGVDYYFSAHFFLWSDGAWHLGQQGQPDYQRLNNSLYVSRAYGHPHSDKAVSDSARDAILAEIEPAINKWAAENPAEIAQAQVKHVSEQIEKNAHRKADAMRELQQATDEEQALQAEYDRAVAQVVKLSGK